MFWIVSTVQLLSFGNLTFLWSDVRIRWGVEPRRPALYLQCPALYKRISKWATFSKRPPTNWRQLIQCQIAQNVEIILMFRQTLKLPCFLNTSVLPPVTHVATFRQILTSQSSRYRNKVWQHMWGGNVTSVKAQDLTTVFCWTQYRPGSSFDVSRCVKCMVIKGPLVGWQETPPPELQEGGVTRTATYITRSNNTFSCLNARTIHVIYIYIYTHTYIYIHIYIDILRRSCNHDAVLTLGSISDMLSTILRSFTIFLSPPGRGQENFQIRHKNIPPYPYELHLSNNLTVSFEAV
jgi:hypothetical protein